MKEQIENTEKKKIPFPLTTRTITNGGFEQGILEAVNRDGLLNDKDKDRLEHLKSLNQNRVETVKGEIIIAVKTNQTMKEQIAKIICSKMGCKMPEPLVFSSYVDRLGKTIWYYAYTDDEGLNQHSEYFDTEDEAIDAYCATLPVYQAAQEIAEMMDRGWVSVREDLPKGVTSFKTMSEFVQVNMVYGSNAGVGVGRYCHDRKRWFAYLPIYSPDHGTYTVTHWQPLPPPISTPSQNKL